MTTTQAQHLKAAAQQALTVLRGCLEHPDAGDAISTPQPAKPLSDKQVEDLINAKHFSLKYIRTASDEACLRWYRLGVRDCEIAHGIIKETS